MYTYLVFFLHFCLQLCTYYFAYCHFINYSRRHKLARTMFKVYQQHLGPNTRVDRKYSAQHQKITGEKESLPMKLSMHMHGITIL